MRTNVRRPISWDKSENLLEFQGVTCITFLHFRVWKFLQTTQRVSVQEIEFLLCVLLPLAATFHSPLQPQPRVYQSSLMVVVAQYPIAIEGKTTDTHLPAPGKTLCQGLVP